MDNNTGFLYLRCDKSEAVELGIDMTDPVISDIASAGVLRWAKPAVEDFGVAEGTEHLFSAGIDNYEGDNPGGYGS